LYCQSEKKDHPAILDDILILLINPSGLRACAIGNVMAAHDLAPILEQMEGLPANEVEQLQMETKVINNFLSDTFADLRVLQSTIQAINEKQKEKTPKAKAIADLRQEFSKLSHAFEFFTDDRFREKINKVLEEHIKTKKVVNFEIVDYILRDRKLKYLTDSFTDAERAKQYIVGSSWTMKQLINPFLRAVTIRPQK